MKEKLRMCIRRDFLLIVIFLSMILSPMPLLASKTPRIVSHQRLTVNRRTSIVPPILSRFKVFTRPQLNALRESYALSRRGRFLPTRKGRLLPLLDWFFENARVVVVDGKRVWEVSTIVHRIVASNGRAVSVRELIFSDGNKKLQVVDDVTGMIFAESKYLIHPALKDFEHGRLITASGKIEFDLIDKREGVVKSQAVKPLPGDGWTLAALEAAISYWTFRFGAPPENLPSILVGTNALIFFNKFEELKEDYPNLAEQDAYEAALRETPAGKARIALGYTELRILYSPAGCRCVSFSAKRPTVRNTDSGDLF